MVYGDRRQENRRNNEIEKVIENINNLNMLKEMTPKDFADEGGYADLVAKVSKKSLKTTQLRKFFAALREIENQKNWKDMEMKFYLLKPQLAYSKGRRLIPQEFHELMKVCMRKVDVGTQEEKVENFKRMMDFLEAIVAYHKFYNPKA